MSASQPLPPAAPDVNSSAAAVLSSLEQQQFTVAEEYLSRSLDKWSFNVFDLDRITAGRSMLYTSMRLFDYHGLIRSFQLDVLKLLRCIGAIEASYNANNPYHTAVHAADVLQATHCNIAQSPLCRLLSPVSKMAAMLAAASHDIDHPGVNQSFLSATDNPLAYLHSSGSLLERHHWRSTLSILHQSRLFDHLDTRSWKTLRRCVEELILATDITRHQDFVANLKEKLDQNSLDVEGSESHRTFALQIALKCADICNPCRPWKISKRWSHLICEEFFQQGDRERVLGLTVSSMCDRRINSVADIQIGFMSHVVEPLFVEWQRFAPSHHSRMMLTHLRNNRIAWQQHQAQVPALTSLPPPPPPPSNHDPSRRHSLPASRDEAAGSRDRRRHSAARLLVDGVIQLAALEERSTSSAQVNGHCRTINTRPDDRCGAPAWPPCHASSADRRLSLNTCSAHAQRTAVTSRRRSRSLVTPFCHLANSLPRAPWMKPDVTSSSRDAPPITRTGGDDDTRLTSAVQQRSSESSTSRKLKEKRQDLVPSSAAVRGDWAPASHLNVDNRVPSSPARTCANDNRNENVALLCSASDYSSSL